MNKFFNRWGTLFVFLLLTLYLSGQSREQLEKERNEIIAKIELTNKTLQKTRETTKATLDDLKAIDLQILNRTKLIENIQQQLKQADETISSSEQRKEVLGQKLSILVEEYKKLLKYSWAKQQFTNKWTYIFSSASLNEAFVRWRYSQQFETYIHQKTSNIERMRGNIDQNIASIEADKERIQRLLEEEKSNKSKLQRDQKRKDQIYNSLKVKEEKLKKELGKQQKEREKLNNAIENIILKELAKKKEVVISSASFSKGNLPWPCEGYVSSSYGTQPHPTISNVKITNNGIDITTTEGSKIQSVAKGNIIGITSIPGYDFMVIIQHGAYYTVYSRLKEVVVKQGQEVEAGTTIGQVNDQNTKLHFELWKGKTKLDPAEWLIRK